MAKRVKVSTAKTTSVFNPLTGQRELITRTYAEAPQQPYAPMPVRSAAQRERSGRRWLIVCSVLLVVGLIGASPVIGVILLVALVIGAVLVVRSKRQRRVNDSR